MIKTVDAARKCFEELYLGHCPSWFASKEYVDKQIQEEWLIFLKGFEAAWSVTKPSQYETVDGNVIWHLDVSEWESIQEAAAKSNWIPVDYFMNDWCSDVRSFLLGNNNDEQS